MRLGRFVQAFFLFVSLAAVVLVHSPWAPLPAQAMGHAVTNAIGQEVRWSMFAFDPRGFWGVVQADIDYEGGAQARWVLDVDGGHDYRVHKWIESAALEGHKAFAPFGAWLGSDESVESVTIWLHRHEIHEPPRRDVAVTSEPVYRSGRAEP